MKRFLLPGILFFTLFMAANSVCGAQPTRLVVFPVIFIPKDVKVSEKGLKEYADKFQSELRIAQTKYNEWLDTDTFAMFIDRKYNFCYGANDTAFYDSFLLAQRKPKADRDRTVEKEVLDWNHDNRIDSRIVYVILFMRPNNHIPPGNLRFGGGRTFNGPPNTGGGFIDMEMSSLLFDKPYVFKSTIVHELGHTFGLTHVNCFGYDLYNNHSIMSYSPFVTSGFNPEEYYILSLNKLAFPNFRFIESKHNPEHKSLKDVDRCFLGCMEDDMGTVPYIAGKGYELLSNGKLASKPEARFYTRWQAQKNCQDARKNNKGKVECRYNGVRF